MTLAPNVVIVDKDFNEINELQKVFGNLTIALHISCHQMAEDCNKYGLLGRW